MFINTYVILHAVLDSQSLVSVKLLKWRTSREHLTQRLVIQDHTTNILGIYSKFTLVAFTARLNGLEDGFSPCFVSLLVLSGNMHSCILMCYPAFYTSKGKQLECIIAPPLQPKLLWHHIQV